MKFQHSHALTSTLKPLAAALLLCSTQALAASPFDELVVFGDSLSDSGQFPDAGGPINPNFMVPASGLRFTNRVNGAGSETDLVGVQRLSQQLGLGYLAASTPYLPSPVTGFPAGTNYAVGGYTSAQIKASITDENGSVVFNPAAGPAKVRDGYLAEYGSAKSSTLYYVNGGGNDVLGLTNPADPNNVTNIVTAANTLVEGINALAAAGAEYIMVSNLPDVGNTPAGIGSGAQPLWSPMSSLYNDTLYAGLTASNANVIPVDTRGLMGEILAEPARYGFVDDAVQITATCYDGSGGSCLENPVYGMQQAGNGDPTKLVFNDGVHPTAAAQQIIADYMYSLISAPQELGQLPVLGASLVDADHIGLKNQMQANLASHKLGAGNWQIFARGQGHNLRAQNGYADASAEPRGAALGMQYGLSDTWSLGLAFASNSGDLSFAESGSELEAQSQAVSLFTGFNADRHWANASLHFGKQSYDSSRQVALGVATRTETGDTDGSSLGFSAEYGYNISPHATWDYGPKLELAYRSIDVNGFAEDSGMTTALNVEDQEHTSLTADVGLFVHWRADQLVVTSEWGIRSELKGEDYEVTMSSQTLALNDYSLPGYRQDKGQAWHGNLSASYYFTDAAAITASWQTERGDNRTDLLGLGVSVNF
ncbi:autotransporter domain-containing protein [Simiduia sp. 21SJ11W-1]|uniref:autotransporter domain-containing protein n=1 Tax=Simiduia sp. 21SJ11W-1 TaxID=2909669 RepID=UPI00209CEA70|nr:autotransporter domain-containing protein [Simiduia sp. 21SJ11W-1]UTA48023.1 autotransporter domain-containing protein [Simiduia sp. 21SJ11W-1]